MDLNNYYKEYTSELSNRVKQALFINNINSPYLKYINEYLINLNLNTFKNKTGDLFKKIYNLKSFNSVMIPELLNNKTTSESELRDFWSERCGVGENACKMLLLYSQLNKIWSTYRLLMKNSNRLSHALIIRETDYVISKTNE